VKIRLDNGITLGYDDAGGGSRALLFTHGLGCNRKFMAPQVGYFSDRYRIVNVDLRGHGESDKPRQDYHPDVQAHDLAQLCARLGITRPVLVGHSLGGVVGLRLAHLYPDLLSGLIALDAAIAVSPEVAEMTPVIVERLEGLEGEDYRKAVVDVLSGFFLSHDDPDRREMIIDTMSSCRKDVFLSGWLQTVVHTDSTGPLASLPVPMLYIAAPTPNGGLDQIRAGANVTVAQTVGSGHFIELECPDQVNAMIARFLYVNDFV
jgi:pimeloyl-ACP methyl ester carboxylesterase